MTVFLDDVEESKNHFRLKFKNSTDAYGWDFEIDYGIGLGLRNLSVIIQNKTLNKAGKTPKKNSSSSSGSKSSSGSSSKSSGSSSKSSGSSSKSSGSNSKSKSSGSGKKLRLLASSGSSSGSKSSGSKKPSGSSGSGSSSKSNSKNKNPKAPKLGPTKKRKTYFFVRGPKSLPIPSMPAFSTKFIMIPLHSFLGTVWRIFYWLSYLLIFCFDLWSVRWKDWGVIRKNRSTSKKKLKTDRPINTNNEALQRQETPSIHDTSSFTNSLNLVPLLLFHTTYFLITFISFFNINYRPVVSRSNIGLHNAIHQNYFFLAPEMHYFEGKYLKKEVYKGHLFDKGGFNTGFWGQGLSSEKAPTTPGLFHKILNWMNFKETYYGRFFTENSLFKDRFKITEYGIGNVIIDRFGIEFSFYIIFALLGLILGGPKVVNAPSKTSEKKEEKSSKTAKDEEKNEETDKKKEDEEKNEKTDQKKKDEDTSKDD